MLRGARCVVTAVHCRTCCGCETLPDSAAHSVVERSGWGVAECEQHRSLAVCLLTLLPFWVFVQAVLAMLDAWCFFPVGVLDAWCFFPLGVLDA